MDNIVFPTFEDLIKFDEAEFVRLEDFDLSKSLYRDLIMETQPASDQAKCEMECRSEETPRREEVEIPVQIDRESFLLNTEGGHIVEISASHGRFKDTETTRKINGTCEDIRIMYEVQVSQLPKKHCQFENLEKRLEMKIPPSKEKSFLCEVCGKRYSNERSLINHSFIHTGVPPYTCHKCHRRFRFNTKLKEHHKREPCCQRAVGAW